MPIEIRELVIRATVDPGSSGGAAHSPAASTSARSSATAGDDLVQTCVREVMRILEDKRER